MGKKLVLGIENRKYPWFLGSAGLEGKKKMNNTSPNQASWGYALSLSGLKNILKNLLSIPLTAPLESKKSTTDRALHTTKTSQSPTNNSPVRGADAGGALPPAFHPRQGGLLSMAQAIGVRVGRRDGFVVRHRCTLPWPGQTPEGPSMPIAPPGGYFSKLHGKEHIRPPRIRPSPKIRDKRPPSNRLLQVSSTNAKKIFIKNKGGKYLNLTPKKTAKNWWFFELFLYYFFELPDFTYFTCWKWKKIQK